MDNSVEIILEATESLRNKNKGRYFENIAEICQNKHGWNNTITSAALDEAIKQNKIFSSVVNGKLSYRKCDKRVRIHDDYENRYTQTDTLTVNEHISKGDLDRIQEDLEDLKLFAHGEIKGSFGSLVRTRDGTDRNFVSSVHTTAKVYVRCPHRDRICYTFACPQSHCTAACQKFPFAPLK